MFRELLKHGSVLTAGNVVAGLFSYAFMILAARGLGPADFGALGALLSLFYIASSLISAIITLVSRNVAEARARDQQADITHLVRSPLITVGLHSVVVLAIYVLASPGLDSLLKINDLPAVILMGPFCVMAALSGILRGALQGVHRFGAMAAIISCEALVRLLLGVVCYLVGFTLVGALLAYLCSTTISFALTFPFLPVTPRMLLAGAPRKVEVRTSPAAFGAALAFAMFAGISQVDMIAAKMYLPAEDAGHYAAACTFVKTPFLLAAGSFAMAMFPTLVGVRTGTHAGRNVLRFTLAALGCGLIGAIAVCFWFAAPIAVALLGAAFLPLASWLGVFAIAASAPAVLAVVMRYVLLSDARLLSVALAVGLLVQVAVLSTFHATVLHLCASLLAGGLVPLMVVAIVPALRRLRVGSLGFRPHID